MYPCPTIRAIMILVKTSSWVIILQLSSSSREPTSLGTKRILVMNSLHALILDEPFISHIGTTVLWNTSSSGLAFQFSGSSLILSRIWMIMMLHYSFMVVVLLLWSLYSLALPVSMLIPTSMPCCKLIFHTEFFEKKNFIEQSLSHNLVSLKCTQADLILLCVAEWLLLCCMLPCCCHQSNRLLHSYL